MAVLCLYPTGWAVGQSPSASELLEKAIYSEQTKGDLDAAMLLYERVIGEGKAGQSLAAQAQYRLGVCLYKKKQYTEATAAFEKLIKDYPEEKSLISQARQYLSGAVALLPAPWTDGEELQMDIRFPTGFKIGTGLYRVNAAEVDGRKTWRLSSRMMAGAHSFSYVEAERDSLKPLSSRWNHALIGDVEARYMPEYAELKSAGKAEVKKIELEGTIYDNEEAIQLMRRLPLEANYTTTLRFLSSLASTIVPVKITVTGPEKIDVPAGSFNCYKVDLNIRQVFWYSADSHRYLVKFEGNGAIAELASISHRAPNEPVRYQDPAFGFTLKAPPGWAFARAEEPTEKSKTSIAILDPEALIVCFMQMKPLEKLDPEAQKSVRVWADKLLQEHGASKEIKVRADSWQERNVAGEEGVSVIADFRDGKEDKIAYLVCSLGKRRATSFVLLTKAQDFEAMRGKWDAIVDSLAN